MRHLVTHGHFRSCDKDGSHTIRCHTENHMLHANFMAVTGVFADRSSAGIGIFDLFMLL